MKKEESGAEIALAAILTFVLLIPVGVFMNAWMLTHLWDWFIVPQFELQKLSYSAALGLGLLIGQLTKQDLSQLAKKEDDDTLLVKVGKAFFKVIFQPLFVVAFGKLILLIF